MIKYWMDFFIALSLVLALFFSLKQSVIVFDVKTIVVISCYFGVIVFISFGVAIWT